MELKVAAVIGTVVAAEVLGGVVRKEGANPDPEGLPVAPPVSLPVVLPDESKEGVLGPVGGLCVAGSEFWSELGARGGGLGKV